MSHRHSAALEQGQLYSVISTQDVGLVDDQFGPYLTLQLRFGEKLGMGLPDHFEIRCCGPVLVKARKLNLCPGDTVQTNGWLLWRRGGPDWVTFARRFFGLNLVQRADDVSVLDLRPPKTASAGTVDG